MKDLVLLGVITGAHGIRGEVRLRSFTAEPKAIADYGPLSTRDGGSLEIVRLKPAKDGFLAALRGIADRNSAEALKGTELFVERARLPRPGEDEIYIHDLVGLDVESPNGEKLGEIIGVENYGAGDLLNVRFGGTGAALVPFTDRFVTNVDSNRVVIDLPAGYLETEGER